MLRKIGDGSKNEALFVLVAGILLSFNSGYINGCCLSGLLSENGSHRQSASAFTGTYTKSGLALADGQTSLFGFEISMILCFISGAFVSGCINPKAVPHELGPSYGPTFLIGALFMILAAVFSEIDPEGKRLFYFAALANGLQNGMTSMYSANLIRTSHLTGTSTDIGLILGQMVRGNRKNAWKFCVLVGLASSFWLGGLLSFWAVTEMHNHALIFSAALFLTIGLSLLMYIVVTQKVSIVQAAMGTWKWDKALKRLSLLGTDGTTKDDERILEVFDQIDADGNGTIDASELKGALNSLGMRVTDAGIKAMIDVVDANNDGVIDKEEFLALADMASLRARKKSKAPPNLAHRHSSMVDPFGKDLSRHRVPMDLEAPAHVCSQCSLRMSAPSLNDGDGGGDDNDNDNASGREQAKAGPGAAPVSNGASARRTSSSSAKRPSLPPLPRTIQEATADPLRDPRAIVVTEASRPFSVVAVNRAWEDLCGYDASEARGKNMKELIQGPQTNREDLKKTMSDLIEGAKEVECDTVNYRKDRSTFLNRLRMGPLTDEDDEGNGDDECATKYFVGVLTNIAELANDYDEKKEEFIDDDLV